MNNIVVVSMGPGSEEYILPAARMAVESCDMIAGSDRMLNIINTSGKEVLKFSLGLNKIIKRLMECPGKKRAVLVSGDAGFYSFCKILKREFGNENIDVIPGISSLHYLLAKTGLSWEDTAFISLHGRDLDFIPIVKGHRRTAMLTDNKNTPREIARRLTEHHLGEMMMYVGNRLSYDDEEIIRDLAKNIALPGKEFTLAAAVVSHE